MRLSIHICTKGRNDALALLLESLRNQTHKEWDLVILDNNNGTNEQKVPQHYLCQCIFNRLQYEGHRIHVIDNSTDTGPRDIGRYRNILLDKDPFNNPIGVRIDDDSICESNYLEILIFPFIRDSGNERKAYIVNGEVMTNENSVWSNVGIVGGIVPYYYYPVQHNLMPAKFNEVTPNFDWTDNCIHFYRMLDDKGNDKHWSQTFFESGHVRSSYAYRMDLARELRFPEYSGPSGFTEETAFCCKVWMKGYTVLFNPNAVCWHLSTPYGGGRDTIKSAEEMEKIKITNLETLKKELSEFRLKLGIEPRGYP